MNTISPATEQPPRETQNTRRRDVLSRVYRLFGHHRQVKQTKTTTWIKPDRPECNLHSRY